MNKAQNELFDSLLDYWQKVVNELVKNLEDEYKMSSGLTAQSVGEFNNNPVTLTSQGFKVTISMPDYYQFLDEGVSGAKFNTSISRFRYKDKMPPIKAIRRFMLNRGITQPKNSNTKAGKARDKEDILNGIAFAIARSIYNKGLKKTEFYSSVINDEELVKFEQRLLAQYQRYVLDVIQIE